MSDESSIEIDRVDHLVLTVENIERACEFYSDVLGMRVVTFGDGRKALAFGKQKINLHLHGQEFEPKANKPTPGSADICLIATTRLVDVISHLKSLGIEPLEGPVFRTGATGAISSVYIRDPDKNLIEISNYER